MDEVCNRNIWMTGKDIGIMGKRKCGKPVHKNGVCLKHYNRDVRVTTKWGERKNYAEATMEDMTSGRSLKLKDTCAHRLYRYNKGVIELRNGEESHGLWPVDRWIPTDIKPDNTLFCVKIL